MCSGEGDWTCLQPGFPIRKSSDHSLVIDSPRLIADSYVLLRFLVPRHPPFALKNLATYKDARVHCVVLNIRAVPHRTRRLPHPPTNSRDAERFDHTMRTRPVTRSTKERPHKQAGPNPQDPTTCQTPPPPDRLPLPATHGEPVLAARPRRRQLIDVPPMSTCRGTNVHDQALDHHASRVTAAASAP